MCDICTGRSFGRRGFVSLAAAGVLASLSATAGAQPVSAAATAAEAQTMLLEGNARYVAGKPRETDFSATRASRALGQAPFAAILGCADSRVAPELVFDQGPGNLFVVRVAGNLLTPDGLASLEFGTAVLGTKVIMVLGHSGCGAVAATVTAIQKGNKLPGHIASLVRSMKPGIEGVLKQPGGDLVERATVANVRYSVQRVQNATPILADMVSKHQLHVIGGVYDIATGKVSLV